MIENVLDILLVEDNSADAELAIDALEAAHVSNRIKILRDGQEALDYIFATGNYANRYIPDNPQMILLDLHLPKVDGLEVLQRIRSDERTRHIPVAVLLSSREDRNRVENCGLAINSYIVKPIEFGNVACAIVEMGLFWVLAIKDPYGDS